MKTRNEKVNDAVHAAMGALGLSPENCPDLADHLNEVMTHAAILYLVTDDDEDEGQRYIILNEDTQQAWSNENGWTDLDGDDYDVFDANERETLNLPIGGYWRELS